MDYKIAALVVVLVLLETTHSTLVQRMRTSAPLLIERLGRTGPGYYMFGLFWFAPDYRRALTSGRLEAELAARPTLRRLAVIEKALWYLMWLAVVLAVLI